MYTGVPVQVKTLGCVSEASVTCLSLALTANDST